jgi:hypothetical protein
MRNRTISRIVALLAAATVVVPALIRVTAAPARADCPFIPPDHDPNVILIVYDVGIAHSVSDRVMLAGFEAGWVESHMNNLPCGDKDSLGVFQQRPSQGWGTPEQIMNVEYAATQFFTRAIVDDGNCTTCTAGQIAQRVQRSGFPERYDRAEAKARALMAEARASHSSVGGSAYMFGDQQHVVGVSAGGSLTKLSWSPSTGLVEQDWGGGTLEGKAIGYVHNGQQHVFARGADNTLRHWWQSGSGGPGLEDWNTAGRVMSDPTGFAYGDQQHVFFRNPDGDLEHRFYDLNSGQVFRWGVAGRAVRGQPVRIRAQRSAARLRPH